MRTALSRRRFLECGAVALATTRLQAQTYTPPVEVQIDPNRTLGRTPDDFLGFGYETSSVPVQGLLSPDNHTLLQLYRNLGTEGVVRIGGNTADFTAWSPGGDAVSAPKNSVLNRGRIHDLGQFLKAARWKLIWNLNLGSGSAEAAADEAVAVANSAGDRLLCFQIGNEPDLFFHSGHRPESYDYAAYYAEFARFATTLRKKLPDAPLAGPDVARATQWVRSFAQDEGKRIKLLTEHYYRAGQRQPAATFENLLNTDPRFLTMLNELRTMSQQSGIPYRLVEINSFSGGGKPGVSDTFASALWALDLMFTLASYDGAGLNLETGLNQLGFVSSYSPIFDDQQGHLTVRPSYYAMLAFGIAGTGERIQTEVNASGMNFTAYATVDKTSRIWVTLINKDVRKGAHVILGSKTNFASADAIHLTAPAFDATSGVTLAGAEVSPEGIWTPKEQPHLYARRGQLSVDISPASAVLLRLRS